MDTKPDLEFTDLVSDTSKSPHYFAAFRHHRNDAESWREVVKLCLQAWRLEARAYRVDETGFDPSGITGVLNERGQRRLPDTPPEDQDITKNSFITDITEVLALRLLAKKRPGARFPYPRVLHKVRGMQHHGIDILGYERVGDDYTLLVVEVMASVSASHPPTTVQQHYNQLVDTLSPAFPERLLADLEFVHDECTDPVDKDVLNQFIVRAENSALSDINGQLAVAILIRPANFWLVTDWDPFLTQTASFEASKIPATVWFGAVECDTVFSALMDQIKADASASS